MRILASVAMMVIVLSACGEPQHAVKIDTPLPAPPPGAAPPADEPGAAKLTPQEVAAGWKLLFNGTDLSGWKGYKKDAPGAAWQVQDGAIALTAGGAGDLMTVGEYGPFELSVDWKISPGGNSGIIYLIKEMDGADNTYNTGPEMQVLDNDGHADGKFPTHRAGALYDFVTPPDGAVKPVGEWNTAVIKFTGSKIEHWLNGTLVSETSYGDEAWKKKVAASKFKQWPMFGLASKGHISLQDHGNQVWYRNIKIKA